MLPQRIKSAASACVLKALCKKANSRKQMRAFLVKLAADKLTRGYKFAPRGSTLKKISPVPGARGREGYLNPSMAKAAVSPTAPPKLPAAPAAPKAPAMPAAPKAPAALKPPAAAKPTNTFSQSGMNAALGDNLDTAHDLANMQNSPGIDFYSDQNPTYSAMRGPDQARLAPKPKMRPGMSNEINYGTGPSGNPVTADIVPGGIMPVGRPAGPTQFDKDQVKKYRDFRTAGRSTVNFGGGQAAPDSPPLTQLLAGMTPSQRLAYKKQNVFSSPEAYANRNQIASQELARRAANSAPIAPELAPVPIPEPVEAPPVSTPLTEAPVPESVPVPPLSSVMPSPATATPDISKANPLDLGKADVPSLNQFNPQAMAGSVGRAAGQQLGQTLDPNFLFNLFSNLRSAMPQGIGNLFTNTGTPFGSRAASPSSYMQTVNDAVNDNSWREYDWTRGKDEARNMERFEQLLRDSGLLPNNFQL